MKFFIDTANVEDIKKAAEMGIIDGVTTNPSLIAREGRDLIETIREISNIVDGPISAEVVSLEADKMVEEATELYEKIGNPNLVIKIPMCIEGLKAVKRLTALGMRTNVTLIFSAGQALLAAAAGATYVSPFVGRLDDVGFCGIDLISEISEIFTKQGIKSQIIAASTRNPLHVIQAAAAGCDVATVPYKVFVEMTKHPLTDKGIERFLADWKNVEKR